MLVELDVNVTYSVGGTFEIPDELAEQLDFGEVDCPSPLSEWLACSVFDRANLMKWYRGKTCFVIKMLYNVAFTKRVIRKTLIENLNIPTDMYWGFFKLSDNQYNGILNYGEADERYFID